MTSSEVVRTVTVTGTASATARPDRAVLSLGVQSRRPSAASALQVVDERAATLVSALRDAGARDEDLRTTGLNLWFDQSAREYVASYSITVAVPADDAGRFLDAAAEVAGDELTMNGISFSVADPATVVAPLRELAVGDARAKAEVLAAAAGAGLGPVVTIVEGGGGGAVPVFKGGAARLAMAAPIEGGSETLSLQVTVTYELAVPT
ncbi:MAG TPA: SIMPL domain-containing protein [Ilumatobacteraceae bacterium]|nr:SIMPL domain-containing protein [Ilumatobacteraceae bacterium]